MAKHKIWNIGKANEEIASADSVLDPALTSAKITTLKVSGLDVPASEAPVAVKISALLALAAPGTATQDMSELVVSNDQMAKALDAGSLENTQLKAGNSALIQENSQLKSDLNTAKTSIQSLTAANAELNVRHEAALRQIADVTAKTNGLSREISKACVAAGCLDLKLAADATEAQKLEAADAISPADKLTAYQGAVSAALARVGVPTGAIPNAGPQAGMNLSQSNLLAQYAKITDSAARTKFYRANKQAIDAAYRK